MKGGKNPNREQKELLSKKKKNWKDFLFIKEDAGELIFQNKKTGKLLKI